MYEDPKMEAYFNTLPPGVQRDIIQSRAHICTLGELMLAGEDMRYKAEDDSH